MKPFKIKVTPEQSRFIQETLFEKGFSWKEGNTTTSNTNWPALKFNENYLTGWSTLASSYPQDPTPEITFHEFIQLIDDFPIQAPGSQQTQEPKKPNMNPSIKTKILETRTFFKGENVSDMSEDRIIFAIRELREEQQDLEKNFGDLNSIFLANRINEINEGITFMVKLLDQRTSNNVTTQTL